jgi:Extracellular link domain
MESSYHSYSLDKDTNTIKKEENVNFLYNPNNHPPLSVKSTITSMFNMTSFIIFIGFLATFFIFYFILGKFHGPFTPLKIIKSQAINFTCLILLIAGGLYFYYSLPTSDQNDFIRYTMLLFQDEMNDPNTILIMLEFIIIFYLIIYVMNFPMGKEDKPISLHIIEFKTWAYLVMLIIIVFFIYVLNIEIVDLIYFECYRLLDYFTGSTEQPIISTTPSASPSSKKTGGFTPSTATIKPSATPQASCPNIPSDEKPGKKEVFNVSNNLYTYDDAQAICKAYGARLAKYDEIEQAYEAGAEWCNYGWSDGQMAYFPTQKNTWEELQKDPKTKHNCGRPGINGGYISNPYIKFGVNCYGVKPPPNDMEQNILNVAQSKTAGCPTAAPPDPNVEKWKQQLDKLTLNSYNSGEWSQYS